MEQKSNDENGKNRMIWIRDCSTSTEVSTTIVEGRYLFPIHMYDTYPLMKVKSTGIHPIYRNDEQEEARVCGVSKGQLTLLVVGISGTTGDCLERNHTSSCVCVMIESTFSNTSKNLRKKQPL